LRLYESADRVHVIVEVEDIDAASSRLAIETPAPRAVSWGARLFQIRDPDGSDVPFLQWNKPVDQNHDSSRSRERRSNKMMDIRKETDSLGEVDVAADKLWGAQTQRSLEHFSIGKDLIPREMITAYATLKKAAANANYAGKRLDEKRHKLIVQVCDEILAGQHHDMFPLHVWMTGSGT